ncbi:MAG: type II secretion system protein [Terriglobales bacterium]
MQLLERFRWKSGASAPRRTRLLERALAQESQGHKSARGFTLLELMVVVSIIIILISVAVPSYQQHVKMAREAVLREDLYQMRMAIDQYSLDKLRAPQSLDDLVSAGYLREVPLDPFTSSRDTWLVVQEDVVLSVDQNQPGISDVHSGSTLAASDGSAYSSW